MRLERWAPGAAARIDAPGGAEALVLEGTGTESGAALRAQSWVRVPVGGALDLAAGPEGMRLWLKTGHLRHLRVPGTD